MFRSVLVAVTLGLAGCAPPASEESSASGQAPPPEAAEQAGADQSLLHDLDESAPQWLAESKVPSLAVAYLRNGNVRWTRVYGEQAEGVPATAETLYNVASLAKPLSAEIILRLASAGRLSLDEPLSGHWIDPDVADDPRHEKLTLRLALSHQTGFRNWRYQTDGVLRFDAAPGTQLGYSGEGYEYALRFTERKLGTDWVSLAQEYVLAPAGMTSTAWTEQPWFAGRMAVPYASGGGDDNGRWLDPSFQESPSAADDVYTTIGDYAAFLAGVMNREGLTAELAEQRNSMHVHNPQAAAGCDPQRVTYCPERAGMGLGWEIIEYPRDTVLLHTGGDVGEQTMVLYFPERREGAVLFTNGSNGFQVMLPAVALLFAGTDLAEFALSRR